MTSAVAERDALLEEAAESEAQIRSWQGRQQRVLAKLSRSRCPDELTPRAVDKH